MARVRSGGDPSRQLEFILNETSRLMTRVFSKHYRRVGVNGNQAAVLILLSRASSGMSQTEIADAVSIGKAPVGKMIDFLESAGFVSRQRSDEDRRVQIVTISGEGMEFVRELDASTKHLNRIVRKGTTRDQRRQAIELIETVRRNLSEIET
ncbi:MAG: MarR family winged helix-turn-helix transcriptional regulator [Phycisphaerales bacterium JB058]